MANSTFYVASPHTTDECLTVLDSLSDKGSDYLKQWHFACPSGDHTSYAFIHAENEREARNSIPEPVRNKARITEVKQFDQQQIRQMHETAPVGKGRNR